MKHHAGRRERLIKLTSERARTYIKDRIKVNEAGCWVWQGTSVGCYGIININFHRVRAHVVSYKDFVKAELIPTGFVVHHRCEVPRCVNPEHLQVISSGENISIGKRSNL